MSEPVVRRVADPEALARAAAGELVRVATRAVGERDAFALALAGGETPRRLYELLADPREPFRDRIAWSRTHVFFGDERPVPPDHRDSNFRMAREALLGRVPAASVHRIRGEDPAAAEEYEAELRRFFAIPAGEAPPRLDLVLLGLGTDAHTASLFPRSPALEERRRWVAAPFVERLGTRRITLTLPILDRARAVLFLVSGGDKAEALARVLEPAAGEELPPAARVRPEGEILWFVDRAAASRLGAAAEGPT